MVDVVDVATRSRMMAGIKSKNTKPELVIRRSLHSLGFRYRLHVKTLPGRPDLVLTKYNATILIHGCFWHGHNCTLFKWPKTRVDFWQRKIMGNKLNDEKTFLSLQQQDWRICTIWECALRGKTTDINGIINKIVMWLHSESKILEISS